MNYILRAVVVGINEYSNPRYREESRLLFAQNDAQDVASTLRTSTAFRLEPDNPHILLNNRATERTVRTAMQETFSSRSYDRNTIALFYFAGHGVCRNNRVFLCCHDVDFADPEHGGIRLNDIYDWLASSSAECAIAIIDACFSGGIMANRFDHISAAEQAQQAIEAMRGPDGKTMFIFAACRADQKARENNQLQHGLFTYQMLRGLRGDAAQDSDGTVYLFGLANFLTKQFANERQRPQITMRGGQAIPLWHSTSPASQSPLSAPLPNQSITVSEKMGDISIEAMLPTAPKAGDVYVQATLPTAAPDDPQKQKRLLFIAIAVVLVALLMCGLLAHLIHLI